MYAKKVSFFEVNFQAVVDGNLRVITAAVNELHERDIAAATRKNIVSCLVKLGILEKQIYSLITDNGSNILKVGELMRSDFSLPENFASLNDKDECEVTETSIYTTSDSEL